ncbi:MAG: hypothetical protein IKA16_02010 [Oscillospiraceae bacterium]|nr:hypothetical protein [Oscillospiraceae bacterium]
MLHFAASFVVSSSISTGKKKVNAEILPAEQSPKSYKKLLQNQTRDEKTAGNRDSQEKNGGEVTKVENNL